MPRRSALGRAMAVAVAGLVLVGLTASCADAAGAGTGRLVVERSFTATGLWPFGGSRETVWSLSSPPTWLEAPRVVETDLSGRELRSFAPVVGTTPAGNRDVPSRALLAPDGSILVGSFTAVRRYSADGVLLDQVLGPANVDVSNGIALEAVDPDGNLLVHVFDRVERFSAAGAPLGRVPVASYRFAVGPDGTVYGSQNDWHGLEVLAPAAVRSVLVGIAAPPGMSGPSCCVQWTAPVVASDGTAWSSLSQSLVHATGQFALRGTAVVGRCSHAAAGDAVAALPGGGLVTLLALPDRTIISVLRSARPGERAVCDELAPRILTADVSERTLTVAASEPARLRAVAHVGARTLALHAIAGWRSRWSVVLPREVRRAPARARITLSITDPNGNATVRRLRSR